MGELEYAAIAWAAAIIDFGGTLVIVAYAAAGLAALVAGRTTIDGARRLVAAGALSGLFWKGSATLLKTIELQTLDQIAAAFAIFALRHIIILALNAERRRARGP